jgi:hypothetical protein
MHGFIKFASVFALALLAFCGELAVLEIILAPLVPAMAALGSQDAARHSIVAVPSGAANP